MLKHLEMSDINSCLNKAKSKEMVFVLLARDEAAPVAIRAWVEERIRLGKNQDADEQISEALLCAHRMELQRKASR